MFWSPLSLKASGVYHHLPRTGQLVVCQLHLLLDLLVQINHKDDQKDARAQVLLHAWLAGIPNLGMLLHDWLQCLLKVIL